MNNKKQLFEQFLKRKFIIGQTNYPLQAGLYDYGPILVNLKNEVLSVWRDFFIEENFYEIEPSVVLPHDVLKNSGHLDRFCDIVLTDGDNTYRADHYIEDRIGEWHLLPVDFDSNTEIIMDRLCKGIEEIKIDEKSKYKDFPKDTKNELLKLCADNFCKKHISDCTREEIDFVVKINNLCSENKMFLPAKNFNLIFKLGSENFLRPELAQSLFCNFKRILEFSNSPLPIAGFCIGNSYRNEINPRSGLLRTREFAQAEIEYFHLKDEHPNIADVHDIHPNLFPNYLSVDDNQLSITVMEALNQNVIKSEIIGYFIGRAYQFLLKLGFKKDSIRFRQHHANEMSHYANDCWDGEILTLSGWIEVLGISNRGCYDLTCHSGDLNVFTPCNIEPKTVKYLEIDSKVHAREFKSRFKEFTEAIQSISISEISKSETNGFYEFEFSGKTVSLPIREKTVSVENVIPSVIEPSFGISRILYSLLEQSYHEIDNRSVLALKPLFCYKHVVISSLRNSSVYNDAIKFLKSSLKKTKLRYGFSTRTCSIGRRYACEDEIGTPFFITLDPNAIKENKVTVRERDTKSQILVQLDNVVEIIENLVYEKVEWDDLVLKYEIINPSS